MADPIALTDELQLPPDEIPDLADFCRELADSPAIAVTRRTGPPEPPSDDDDYVDCRIDGTPARYSPAQAHAVLRLESPGCVEHIRLRSVPSAANGMAVEDAFFTD